jgi:hypothetical protein
VHRYGDHSACAPVRRPLRWWHRYGDATETLREDALACARLAYGWILPPPDGHRSPEELGGSVGQTVAEGGPGPAVLDLKNAMLDLKNAGPVH